MPLLGTYLMFMAQIDHIVSQNVSLQFRILDCILDNFWLCSATGVLMSLTLIKLIIVFLNDNCFLFSKLFLFFLFQYSWNHSECVHWKIKTSRTRTETLLTRWNFSPSFLWNLLALFLINFWLWFLNLQLYFEITKNLTTIHFLFYKNLSVDYAKI